MPGRVLARMVRDEYPAGYSLVKMARTWGGAGADQLAVIAEWWVVWRSVTVRLMGKRKGRQGETAFTVFTTLEFKARFYDRRDQLDDAMRLKVEKEAKARGIRNVQKRA